MRRTTGNEDDAVPQRRTRPTRWHDTRSRATVTMATLAPVALVARPTRAYAQPAVCCKIRPYPVGFHASDLRFYPGVLITPQRDRNTRSSGGACCTCRSPHHSSEGSQLRHALGHEGRAAGPHHSSEGSQRGRDDRITDAARVLITPQRDRNQRAQPAHFAPILVLITPQRDRNKVARSCPG